MKPYYADEWLTVYLGDCREVMATMAPESVHCVVTSPPYWGLRDYGTATWDGGDEACDHDAARRAIGNSPSMKSTLNNGRGPQPGDKYSAGSQSGYGPTCPCGATRIDSQLGLEPTPEAYVENMVAVFRDVRRVLRDDGTVWLNLGDSYASGEVGRVDGGREGRTLGEVQKPRAARRIVQRTGLKPKDLVGIPWRVAFALQADGWYLRSDIIWAKPNPMPESVTDRPTKSHEYLFLLSKSSRYYFDADAVREPHTSGANTDAGLAARTHIGDPNGKRGDTKSLNDGRDRTKPPSRPPGYIGHVAGRNIRSVWTISTQPYAGAHFATFPRALVEPCIKAGTSEKGVCPECGSPWERVVERETRPNWQGGAQQKHDGTHYRPNIGGGVGNDRRAALEIGWRPTCAHDAQPVPATVLDPFAGSGTTGMVAQSLSRRAVLIDLNGEYLTQVMERNRDIPLGLPA